MATTAYRGEFTVRDRGRDLPARISVGTADMLSTQAWTPFLLSADPVVLTWEECALTDVIHRSQLQLNLIAENDGDYRDLAQSAEAIYCLLEVDAGSGFSRWWVGAYADTTWLEPFSREKGYDVQMTFSDFGYLERLDYDGSNFGSTSQGAANVGSIVSWLVSLFSGNVSLPEVRWMLMPSARMNNTALSELFVRDVMFTEDDGTPRNMLDILTDVLDSANVHIMQYGGKVWLFSPDCGAVCDAGDAVSGTLEAAGTDAELESCESYRRMDLTYDPTGPIGNGFKPDNEGFVYDSYANMYDYFGVNSLVLTKMDSMYDVRALSYVNGSKELIKLLWRSARDPLEWIGPVPVVPSGIFPSFIAPIPTVHINLANDELSPNEIIQKRYIVRLSMWGIFVRADGAYLNNAVIDCSVTWNQLGTTNKKYWRKADSTASGYQWVDTPTTDSALKPAVMFYGQAGGKGGKFDLTMNLTDIPGIGTIDISFSTRFRILTDSNGSISWESRPVLIGLSSIDVLTEGYFDSSVMDFSLRRAEIMHPGASDVFSKSFSLGTVEHSSIDAIHVLSDVEGNVTVTEGQTLIDMYADFLRRNYKTSVDFPTRRKVRGSYMYAHTEGFPVFLAESAAPLKSLQRDDRAFFLMSEQWRLRTGIAQLMLEEASLAIPDGTFFATSPNPLMLENTRPGVLLVVTNGYGAVKVLSGSALVVSSGTVQGIDRLTVAAKTDNLTGNLQEYSLLFVAGNTTISVLVTVSPASDEPIAISESLFLVPAYGGTIRLSLTSSTSWEAAVSDSAGLGVKVSPSEGRTGESSPEVTVSGLAARTDREAVVTFSDRWGNMADLTLVQHGQRIADGITEDIVLDADEAEIIREVTTNAAAVRVEIPDALWNRLDSAHVQVTGEDLVEMQPSVPAVVNVCGDAEGAKLFFIILCFRSGIVGVDGTITETALFGDEEVPLAEIRVSDAVGLMTEDGGLLMTEDGQYNILLG